MIQGGVKWCTAVPHAASCWSQLPLFMLLCFPHSWSPPRFSSTRLFSQRNHDSEGHMLIPFWNCFSLVAGWDVRTKHRLAVSKLHLGARGSLNRHSRARVFSFALVKFREMDRKPAICGGTHIFSIHPSARRCLCVEGVTCMQLPG